VSLFLRAAASSAAAAADPFILQSLRAGRATGAPHCGVAVEKQTDPETQEYETK